MPSGFNGLKSKVHKLDIGKLETTSVDLSKLSNVVKNDVVKNTECHELVKKVDAIQTTDASNLVNKTDYIIKINETERKITNHDHDKYVTTQVNHRKLYCKIRTSKFSKQK